MRPDTLHARRIVLPFDDMLRFAAESEDAMRKLAST